MTETSSNNTTATPAKKRSVWALWAVIGVSAAPTIAALIVYYTQSWGSGQTNYGDLLPPNDLRKISGQTLEGKPVAFDSLLGKWAYITVDGGECAEACAKKLFTTRQLRATAGQERSRLQRVWLINDAVPANPKILEVHPDLIVMRVDAAQLAQLPLAANQPLLEPIWLQDPKGNIMLRYGAKHSEPGKIRRDQSKVLKASRIG